MKDLREFIALLRERGELVEISATLDPVLEMTEIADRTVKFGGPALLFTDPRGSSVPVLMNQFGSHNRMCWALGVESYEELSARVAELTAMSVPNSARDKLKALGQLKEIADLQPKSVRKGACQQVVLTGDEIDLEALPILKCWPRQSRRFCVSKVWPIPTTCSRH